MAIRTQAIDMVACSGLDGFSMQKLARAAGVSPATLYIYYKDREDLILQLSAEISEELVEASTRNFNAQLPFDEGMRIQWKNLAAFFLQHPKEMAFIEQIRFSPLDNKLKQQRTTGSQTTIEAFIHHAILRGQLVPLPFEVFWSVAYAPLYQLIRFHARAGMRVAPDVGPPVEAMQQTPDFRMQYREQRFQLTDEVLEQALQLVLKALKPV